MGSDEVESAELLALRDGGNWLDKESAMRRESQTKEVKAHRSHGKFLNQQKDLY